MVIRGSYCLCIRVDRNSDIKAGALGVINFPKGRYVYIGSALNSLIPRLNRHLRTARGESRVTHWHIDYLLRDPSIEIEAIYATDWSVKMECEIADIVAEKGKAILHFGCSDCLCRTHLYKVKSFSFLKKTGLKKVDLLTLSSSPHPQ